MVSWSLVCLAIYAWLFLFVMRIPRGQTYPRWHPILLAAIVLVLAILPLAGYGVPSDWEARLRFSLLVVPVAAIGEELLYRGIIQTALEWVLHPMAAILLSAGLFVLSHVSSLPIFDDGPTASSIAATGVILGAIYQRTRNLSLVIVMHALADWILLLPPAHVIDKQTATIGNILALLATLAWWWLDRTNDSVGGAKSAA